MSKTAASWLYAESLYERGRYSFASCEMDERQALVGHLIKEGDFSEAMEVLVEGKQGDELPYDLANYLINQDRDSAEDFLKACAKNAVNQYVERIDNLFEQVDEDMQEAGKHNIELAKCELMLAA